MSEGRTYLDYNATAPMRPAVAEAVVRALSLPGNPSSVHAEGRAARSAVEAARGQVAALVGASSDAVVFTSGGTEAANAVLGGGLKPRDGAAMPRLLLCATEHACVLDGHRFEAVGIIPVDGEGVLDLEWLEADLAANGPALVCVHAANNETGVVQPVAEVVRLVHTAGGLVLADAVQAAGRLPLDQTTLGVDAFILSAHKLGGPKGVGAVVLGPEVSLRAVIAGGGQERGRRGGTENVPGIVGFGQAAEAARAALPTEAGRLAALRDKVETELRRVAPDAVIFGAAASRLPNTTAFAVPGLRAETALIAFDLAGVALSSGAACSSGKVRRSHVLAAMGVAPSLADGALRVSLGWGTTENDVLRFAEACEKAVAPLYKRKAAAA
ncbi:MAG TPA: cysteine desulfurase family protein [Beijerinckiaceae bacterium]|jgi:cysteine desulfurase